MKTTESTRPLAKRITPEAPRIDPECLSTLDDIKYTPVWIENAWEGDPEAEANVELIAEAFNVTHETGRTPRQLADDRAALIAALTDCAESLSRLPDVDGAYRATTYQQAAKTLADVIAPIEP